MIQNLYDQCVFCRLGSNIYISYLFCCFLRWQWIPPSSSRSRTSPTTRFAVTSDTQEATSRRGTAGSQCKDRVLTSESTEIRNTSWWCLLFVFTGADLTEDDNFTTEICSIYISVYCYHNSLCLYLWHDMIYCSSAFFPAVSLKMCSLKGCEWLKGCLHLYCIFNKDCFKLLWKQEHYWRLFSPLDSYDQ